MTYPIPGTDAEKIARYVEAHPRCTRYAIAKDLGMNYAKVYELVGKLRRNGVLFDREDHRGQARLTYIGG